MSETKRFNRHVATFFPPNLVFIRYDGDVSVSEALEMSLFYSEKTAHKDCRFVVDITELGAIGPAARKELAEQRYAPNPDREQVIDLAFVGASLRTKVLMTVIVAAARMTTKTVVRSHFHGSLREAAAWAGVELSALRG